jgi:hypothetical protein
MGLNHLPPRVDAAPQMRLSASSACTVTHNGAPTVATGSYDWWVPLQHVQHPIYFYNIQMKHLRHTSKTHAKTLEKNLKTRV